jgi:TonB-linked SusC/RagA family outer membrane protein
MGILGQLLLVGLCLAQGVASPKVGSLYDLAYASETKSSLNSESHGSRDFSINREIEVSGTVTAPDGKGIPGVNILVKGTGMGTVSDIDGKYTVNAPNNDDILVFSSIGYATREVAINSRSVIDVTLEEDLQGLDEVVVIGYGTRKKVNLTGSVASVTSEELEKRTVTKASLALQGQMSGISVRQGSGNPGGNSASLLIRGQGTFSGAGNSPLVLVDGIESSIDNVNPNDIESVSVLKDAASAAIFGSKAANGVILIETKKGFVGEPVFSYNSYVGKQSPTMIPEMVNSWEYAEVVNEVTPNRYSAEDIQKFRSGTDPDYPNFDHIGYLFGSGSGFETKHDISMRGGNAATQYMFSAGYYDQSGLIKKNNADQYNIRLNLDTELHEKLRFSVKLAGSKDKSEEPSSPYSAGVGGIISGAMRNANAIPGPTPDGFYGRNETLHPEADLNSKSFVRDWGTSLYGNAHMVWDITNDLKISGQAGYTQGNSEYKAFVATYPVTPTYGITLNSLNTIWSQSSALTLQSFLEYNKTFDDHAIQLLGGISNQTFESKNISAYRDAFPNNEIYEIDAGATVRGRQGGTASRNTLASYFGRANYNFREKYLIEANFRYDGSSRFPEDNRWGLFPSFSAAWRISQESFFQNALPWVSDLKIRGSWGELGNQSIGNYPYQDLIALGLNYPFGNELSAGGAVTTIANKEITWETTQITDIGLDLSLLEDRLMFSADYFVKTTSDILYNVSVSHLLGASPSSTNAGTVENKGWDFNISYRNTSGAFTYGASGIFSFVNNKVIKLANVDEDINRGLFIGHPIGSAYGYVSDGLFVDDTEVDNYATQPFSFLAEAGGIKFVDISGPEGVPDGVVNSTYDRNVIGTPLPITTYALTLNAGFKNFDFHVLLQGEGGRNDMINIGQFFFPLENNSNVQREAYENRWTFDNPDPNASYPRMKNLTSGFYSTNDVDYWYRDATFLRVKNIQLGYSLPETLLNNTFLDQVRVYVSGENLFTFTSYYEGWDPEMQTGGAERFYPLTKLIVGGINVKF